MGWLYDEGAKEKQVTTARVYEMLDEFQEKFDTYDSAWQKEILRQLVDSVEIKADANPKKGETIVKRVRFKCPCRSTSPCLEMCSMFWASTSSTAWKRRNANPVMILGLTRW